MSGTLLVPQRRQRLARLWPVLDAALRHRERLVARRRDEPTGDGEVIPIVWPLCHDNSSRLLTAARDEVILPMPCNDFCMAGREDVHRLVDALPEARLPAIEQVLRASLDGPVPAAPRRFSSAGTLSAERDLAERSEDILRVPDRPDGSTL